MKFFTRSALILIALFAIAFSATQAQESCTLSTAAEYRYAGLDIFWKGDYQQALDLYSCGIALLPDDANLNLPLDKHDPLAGLFLGRAWANTMLGNTTATHSDFYRWIELTEAETIETSLQVAFSDTPVEMRSGLVYRLSFDANEGDEFSFVTASDDSVDPLMVLLAPDGSPIASDDDSGGQINADADAQIQNLVLPQTGRYRLVISQARRGSGEGFAEIIGSYTPLVPLAEAPCNLQNIYDYNHQALNLFWENNYEQALALYECGIALVPADAELDLPFANHNAIAGLYLGRAWSNLMLGNVAETHNDFYRWIVLTEKQTIEQSLELALANNPLPMEEGLVYRLSFEGHRGERIVFSSQTEDSIDPLFVLLAPDGTVLIADDDNGANLDPNINSHIELMLPERGSYTLVIGQAGGSGTGTMQLLVEREAELGFYRP
jgi:tetratricopeptide (TPR) repeat protein